MATLSCSLHPSKSIEASGPLHLPTRRIWKSESLLRTYSLVCSNTNADLWDSVRPRNDLRMPLHSQYYARGARVIPGQTVKSSLLLAMDCSTGATIHGAIYPNFPVFMECLNLSTPTRCLIVLVYFEVIDIG